MATSRDKSATEAEEPKVHDLAGGWITERVGTPIPLFLKLAYVGFSLFGLVYLFRFSLGEVGHATRGALVRQFNQLSQQPPTAWIVMLAAILGLFVVGLLAFAFLAREEE
ncbi:MAG TPA: hypothetical protein VF789_06015 [Thermoanaerobaculia bacterium]